MEDPQPQRNMRLEHPTDLYLTLQLGLDLTQVASRIHPEVITLGLDLTQVASQINNLGLDRTQVARECIRHMCIMGWLRP